MKLRTQIFAIGLAGAAVAALTGGIGLLVSTRLGEGLEDAIVAAQALQVSQEADMMHDAIRGDAQLAALGALDHKPARIAEAERDLKDHGQKFTKALTELQGLAIDAPARAALKDVQPVVNLYIAAATRTVQAARGDLEPMRLAADELQLRFGELEGKLAKLSDAIEKGGERVTEQAHGLVGQARDAVALALLVGSLAMLLGAGAMARSLARPMAHAVAVAGNLAEGDLAVSIQPQGNQETRQVLQALALMRDQLGELVRKVQDNAGSVATASEQIAQGNQELSGRSDAQADALQETSQRMDELARSVRVNADSARQANQLAMGASSVASRGGEMMGQVVQTMAGIGDSSRQIASIIGVIDGIAFQTNILALNAAVEAARAGEQGRGFAVVASEVRGLAQRSAEAAREVKSLVTTSVERVDQGTALINEAGSTMDEIVGAISRVTDIVAEISAASAEQSGGVEQVSQAVSRMGEATRQNSARVEEATAATEILNEQARQLVGSVAVFRTGG